MIGLYDPINCPTAYLPALNIYCPNYPDIAAGSQSEIILFKFLVTVVSMPDGEIGAHDSKAGTGTYSYAILTCIW